MGPKIDFNHLVLNYRLLLALIVYVMSSTAFESQSKSLTATEALDRIIPQTQLMQLSKNKAAEYHLCHTQPSIRRDATADYYVFNNTHGGFLILSADDRMAPVLGQVDKGSFNIDSIPPAMKFWLDEYQREAEAGLSETMTATYTSQSTETRPEIAPLLTCKWNQDNPYNMLCPQVNGINCVTGCVATAMAQVMYYHKWPEVGAGSHSYIWNGQELSIDFSQVNFEWDKMLDIYSNESPQESQLAVAELMQACGISLNMGYGTGASGAFHEAIGNALTQFFDYDQSLRPIYRNSYTHSEIEEIVYDQLSNVGPVIWAGAPPSSMMGHEFVCDGYKNGLFHFNWGWGGYCDGYFSLHLLSPSGSGIGGNIDGYNFGQSIYLDIAPNHGGQPVNQFTISEFRYDPISNKISISFSLAAEEVQLKAISEDNKAYESGSLKIEQIEYKNFIDGNTFFQSLPEGKYTVYPQIKVSSNGTWLNHNWNSFKQQSLTVVRHAEKVVVSNNLPTKNDSFEVLALKCVDSISITGECIPVQLTVKSNEPHYSHFAIGIRINSSETSQQVSLEPYEIKTIYYNLISQNKPGIYDIYVTDYSMSDDILFRTQIELLDPIYQNIGNIRYAIAGQYAKVANNQDNTPYSQDIVIPKLIEYNGNQYPVIMNLSNINFDTENLTKLELHCSVEDCIPKRRFSNCKKLEFLTIPEGVTEIGESTFETCESLKQLSLPSSLIKIGNNAFYNCKSLESLTIPEGVTEIGEFTFSSCDNLKQLSIPSSLVKIGNSTFFNCSNLIELTIPDGVKSIGDGAFRQCEKITQLELPATVEEIGHSAFYSCVKLSKLILPQSLTHVGTNSFFYNETLKEIICLNVNPPALDSTFGYYDAEVTVPYGCLDKYMATEWSQFYKIIELQDAHNPADIIASNPNVFSSITAYHGEIDFSQLTTDTTIEIYSIDGTLRYNGAPTKIKTGAGLFIIKIGNQTQKLYVGN